MSREETRHRLDAVFLDRDGTINVKPPEGRYVLSPSGLELLPGAAEAIRLLNERNIPAIVVTNQRGVARGELTEEMLARIHRRLREMLRSSGAQVDAIYYCPHQVGVCTCRKPGTGLFLRAVEHRPCLRLDRTAVVGDSPTDIEAGIRIGAVTALVAPDANNADPSVPAEGTFGSLLEATRWLLSGTPTG